MSEDNSEITTFVAPPLEELDRLLNGYTFESFIAQGGMGAVYLASQTSLDRMVAVKVLPREFGEDEDFRKSFEAEAKLMAKLNHPNLIGIYDFGDMDGMLYIIMEYVKGKSLHDSAHGKTIAQQTAVEIITGVCAGLDHAHSAGTLHRDIKPANIILGKGATPKIGDFGLARPNDMTESGVIYGTPGYSAPEIIDAPHKVDMRSDIFAVGVMFYELLTGVLPEDQYESVTEYAEVDAKFDKIIKKAIHPNIEMRYRSALDFSDDINDVIKNPSPVNKLLVAGSGNKTSLMVKDAVPSGALSGSAARSLVSPVSMTPTASANSNLTRNIAIIFLLLIAIFIVLEMKKAKEGEVAQTQEEIDAAEVLKQKAEAELRATLEAERKREEARLARIRANQQKNTNTNNNSDDPSFSRLAPMDKLTRVKELLGNGERPMTMMPETIFMRDRDSRIIMYIDEKMTWDEADLWAREYGGYIAVSKSKSDLSVLMMQIPADVEEVWLGAGSSGNKGWSWVDDTPWTDSLSLRPTHERAFAKISKSGTVGHADGEQKLNFFIEWRADGSNPADLEYRLLRTSDTLGDINPKYPPGTITAGARNYCIIKSPVTFTEASDLAISSGGHLIAISNDDEKDTVQSIIAQNFGEATTIWTAAEKQNAIWGWQTGEQWLPLKWASTHPKSENHLVISAGEKLVVKDVHSNTKADAFIIEWSKDASRVKVTGLDSNTDINGGLKTLKDKAKSLVVKQRKVTEKKHAYNVKKLWSDLETYLRGLPVGERAAESGYINAIIEKVKGELRVPANIAGEGPSERSRDYTNYAVEKQARIDLEHITQIELLRTAYMKQLLKMKQDLESAGQVNAVKLIIEEAVSVGSTAEEFEDYFN